MGIKNIVTFGYAEKEEVAQKEFERAQAAFEKWKKTAEVYDENKKCLNQMIQKIVAVCKENGLWEKAEIISKNYADLLSANISVLMDSSAKESLLVGAVFGAAGAVGTFTLAGTFGVASTGVAISSLSGVAATSSTLALLGGGALASGGFGMLGGVCVLGGITAAVAITGAMTFRSYSLVKKYETTTKEINDALEKVPSVEVIEKQGKKIHTLNEKLEEQYHDFNQGKFSTDRLYDSAKELINASNKE